MDVFYEVVSFYFLLVLSFFCHVLPLCSEFSAIRWSGVQLYYYYGKYGYIVEESTSTVPHEVHVDYTKSTSSLHAKYAWSTSTLHTYQYGNYFQRYRCEGHNSETFLIWTFVSKDILIWNLDSEKTRTSHPPTLMIRDKIPKLPGGDGWHTYIAPRVTTICNE